MIRPRGVFVLAGVLLAWLPAAADAPRPADAVSYREQQEGRRGAPIARTIPAGAPAGSFAIDTKSRLLIDVDEGRLAEAVLRLAPRAAREGDVANLLARIDALRPLVATVRERTERAREAFTRLERAGDADREEALVAAQQEIRATGRVVGAQLRALEKAVVLRLEAEGRPAEDARRLLEPILSGPRVARDGYDYDAMMAAVGREIDALTAALPRRADGLALEIRAWLVDRSGRAVPLFLPGYNEVATGPLAPVSKVVFDVPGDQARLFDEYAALARDLGAARGAAGILRRQVEADARLLRARAEATLSRLEPLRAELDAALAEISGWADAARWRAYLSGRLDEAIGADPRARAARERLLEALGGVREDIAALRALAALPERLASLDALSAMRTILAALPRDADQVGWRALRPATWRERIAAAREMLAALDALAPEIRDRVRDDPSGPVAALRELEDVARRAADALEQAGDELAALLVRVAGLERIAPVADLPEPADQVSVPLARPADTEVRLRTVRGVVEEGQRLLVDYRAFVGDEPVAAARWTDEFALRAFGLSSRVVASLGFARQENVADATWEPAPVLSWLLHWRRWPEGEARGAGPTRHPVGFGLTTLTLDFSDEESIETGLALAVSLLDDRIIAGWGVNLQVPRDDTFVFLSLRIFSFGDPLRR